MCIIVTYLSAFILKKDGKLGSFSIKYEYEDKKLCSGNKNNAIFS